MPAEDGPPPRQEIEGQSPESDALPCSFEVALIAVGTFEVSTAHSIASLELAESAALTAKRLLSQ